jgi:hypothetical protein
MLLRTADSSFARLRLGRASAACRALLKATGHAAPRRRAADAGLPASLIAAGVTAREAGTPGAPVEQHLTAACFTGSAGCVIRLKPPDAMPSESARRLAV